jgi:two-component system CheB/CheR fusion protein
MKSTATSKNKPVAVIKSANLFPVVGIGASAGGLDAFKKLLKAIPENSGMAYVLVQHLDPSHESMLPEILQKITRIPVLEISDDIKVEPNRIYVIPSNKIMVATDGVLHLAPRPAKNKTERNLPIDLFFTSLAEVHQTHAIGVVLSGTATDGTLGLKAIKDYGGITFAQDEESAAYEGMPQSAIQAGVVDFILPPEKIPEKILEITQSMDDTGGEEQNMPKQDLDVFKQIIALLRIRKGTDFTYYKQTTVRRRILRRMALNKNKELTAYLQYLRENKQEQDALYQDLLIPVTDFFRDPKSFDNLCETVFPLIAKNKPGDGPIRVWVAGCSTGQEVYTIAICFKEYLGDTHQRVQIFATDLSEPAIVKARIGIYKKSELNAVSPQRINEFFTKINGSYQVNKPVRDMCVFAVHDFLKDPPFSKMDFISCRNVLIYMEPFLQKKALTTFHYSLNPKGFLLLGKSETTSGVPDLFASAAQNDKLFSRKDGPGKFMHVASRQNEQNLSSPDTSIQTEPVRTDFQKTADDIMLSRYTPPGVVINEAMDIVHFRGNTGSYLEQSPGKPSHNLLKMAKQGLAFELRNLLHKVKKDKAAVIKENIPIQVNGSLRNISIEALPLPNTIEPYYLILFHDHNTIGNKPLSTGAKKTLSGKAKKDDKDIRILQLEQESEQAREDMRHITEDQEAANEELQSANEELLSSSEELQSLNEELETNKEELQSTNEELTIVNHEIISLNELVTEARDYSEAIIATIHEPMIILDKNLRVKSANKSFYKNFKVNEEGTEGMLLYDLGNGQWNIPRLRELLYDIIPRNSQFQDFELKHNFPGIGEKVMLLNASRIIQKTQQEQLILLAIEDITVQARYNLKEKYSLSLIEASHDPLVAINTEGKIIFKNEATVNITGLTREKLNGTDFFDYFTEPQKAREVYREVFAKGSVADAPLTLRHKDGKLTDVLFNGSVYKDDKGNVLGAVVVARDITEKKRIEDNLAKSLKEVSDYKYALDESSIVAITDQKGVIQYVNDNFCSISKYTREELIGKDHRIINSGYHPKEFIRNLWATIAGGEIWRGDLKNKAKDGTFYWVETTIVPFLNKQGKIYQYVAIKSDITERKRFEEELKEAKVLAEEATFIAEKATSFAEGAKSKAESATLVAEDAMKAKQQFLSNMSHEIRTPMNAIIGFTKVVLKTDLTAKQREYISAIKISGDSLIVLINDILDLAKVDAGKMTFEKVPFKMSLSISAMLHLFETKIQEKNLELVKEYDPAIPEVLLGDPVRLHQIILNLVSNAIKFTAQGKITVRVHLLSEDEEKVTIEFTVTDTGIGIAANKIDDIFGNFQQASSDTSRLYGGTGLGLAIVKQLVTSQGGSIDVKSKIDEGSVFGFSLSFQKTKEKAELETGPVKPDEEIKNIKVLVVEDIALNQLLMKTLLDDFGFEQDMAGNGKIAIEKLQTNEYDIILMDLQMPEMNGFEATEYIRDTMNSKIPIIALTADVTTVDLAKCKAVGMNDYIAKPVDEKILYAKIVGLVKRPAPVPLMEREQAAGQNKNLKCTDLAGLRRRTKSDPKSMMEMISLYLALTPPLVSAMKQSYQDKDWISLRGAAHKMIPSFSIVGISQDFENMAKKVAEYAPAVQPPDEISDLILQLERVCTQACKELEEEFNLIKNTTL